MSQQEDLDYLESVARIIAQRKNEAEMQIKKMQETRGRNDLALLPRGTKSQKGTFNSLCKEEIYSVSETRY